VLNAIAWTMIGVFYYLFPTGTFVPRWTKPLAVIWFSWQMAWAFVPGCPLDPLTWPPAVAFFVWLFWFSTGVAAQVYRYRRFSDAESRRRSRWVVIGITAAFAGDTLINLPAMLAPAIHTGPLYDLGRTTATYLIALLVPSTIGVAILRHQLWDIDLLISRTLVYVPLTAILGGLYTASIGLFQRLFVATTGSTNGAAIVLTTLVVGAAFTPVKNGLQATVDRRFKEPAGPATELVAFSKQIHAIADALDVCQSFTRLLDSAVAALGATGGAIYVLKHGRATLETVSGDWTGATAVRLPIVAGGQPVGFLALGAPKHGHSYQEAELAILQATIDKIAVIIALMETARPATPAPHRRPHRSTRAHAASVVGAHAASVVGAHAYRPTAHSARQTGDWNPQAPVGELGTAGHSPELSLMNS
jgi:hypothetical protein